jgi:hypothetical protein
MNSLDRQIRSTNAAPKPQVRGDARTVLLVILVSAMFLVTGQAGLTAIAHVGQISIQILVEVCRISSAAFQIFGK